MLLDLGRIEVNGGTQSRSGVEWSVVQEYADAYKAGASMPAVDVFFDGESYWLADGFHRVNAALSAGMTQIETTIHQGTREDAVWFSCGANKAHGSRRSNADKRRAVETALQHPQSKGLSDRAIAEHCGVSNQTVSNVRSDTQVSKIDTNKARIGRDGKHQQPQSQKRSDAAKNRGKAATGTVTIIPGDVEVTDEDIAPAAVIHPVADGPSYDSVSHAALALVELASGLTVAQQDSIVRLISSRIGSRRNP